MIDDAVEMALERFADTYSRARGALSGRRQVVDFITDKFPAMSRAQQRRLGELRARLQAAIKRDDHKQPAQTKR